MTSTPSPTWYDVLGVSPDATPDQIKAAWRDATDKFEPGSGTGQFRMFNEAADVLLDPARRAAYNDSLDAGANGTSPTARLDDTITVDNDPVADVVPPAEATSVPRRPRLRRMPEAAAKASPSAPASWPALIVALVLTLVTVGVLVAAGLLAKEVRSDAAIAQARDDAPAAAERAAKAVFTYDYRHLEADRERAANFLADDYRKEYLRSAILLEKQQDGAPGLAIQTKAVVTLTVVGSAVISDPDPDPDRVRVLLYANQVSAKAGQDPRIFQNRVVATMEKQGNRWLIAKVDTY